VQAEDFPRGIQKVESGGGTPESARQIKLILRRGPLKRSVVFLDKDDILRDESCLLNAEFLGDREWETKHPILLKGKSKFGQLIIRDVHHRLNHMGVRATRAEVRRRFDMVAMGEAIRQEVVNCTFCRLRKPVPVQVAMAPLHKNCLQINKPPFYSTGMDIFGPFKIKGGGKAYGLLYMCLTSRAVPAF
jgi:hypothetical protein